MAYTWNVYTYITNESQHGIYVVGIPIFQCPEIGPSHEFPKISKLVMHVHARCKSILHGASKFICGCCEPNIVTVRNITEIFGNLYMITAVCMQQCFQRLVKLETHHKLPTIVTRAFNASIYEKL
jgi:hypothetical protein